MILSPPKANLDHFLAMDHYYWIPPINFIKSSFDGASKGNLGPTGFGDIFRHNKLAPLLLFVVYCVIATNN